MSNPRNGIMIWQKYHYKWLSYLTFQNTDTESNPQMNDGCLYLQRFCADVVSVLAMTMSGERECLKYRLVGSQEELASWGHEYVR